MAKLDRGIGIQGVKEYFIVCVCTLSDRTVGAIVGDTLPSEDNPLDISVTTLELLERSREFGIWTKSEPSGCDTFGKLRWM